MRSYNSSDNDMHTMRSPAGSQIGAQKADKLVRLNQGLVESITKSSNVSRQRPPGGTPREQNLANQFKKLSRRVPRVPLFSQFSLLVLQFIPDPSTARFKTQLKVSAFYSIFGAPHNTTNIPVFTCACIWHYVLHSPDFLNRVDHIPLALRASPPSSKSRNGLVQRAIS